MAATSATMVTVSGGEAHVDLERLEEEEQSLSLRRRRLHDRIDFLRGSGTATDDAGLAQLLADEREVSSRRRALHERIDALRGQLGLPAVRGPKRSLLD